MNETLLAAGGTFDSETEWVEYAKPLRLTISTGLIVLYLFWLITTPQHSARLAFLADIKFEKILAISLILLTLISGRLNNLFTPVSLIVFGLFGWMCVCNLFSSYPDTEKVALWRETYWKKIVFFAVVAANLKSVKDVQKIVAWTVYIVLFYQLYSWFDFLRGGSHVYQQGMKRMIGTWSIGGIGAANGFGFLGAFALPFIFCYLNSPAFKWGKPLGLFAAGVSLMSIIFSGTRGALLVAIAYLIFEFRTKLLKPKIILTAFLCIALLIPNLNEKIRHRYWGLLVNVFQSEGETKSDEIAKQSAETRIEGLRKGFQLGMKKPIFGYGPATSSFAVKEIGGLHVTDSGDSETLELHNLYGQIAAEWGIIGFGLWLSSMVIIFARFRTFRARIKHARQVLVIVDTLLAGLFVTVCYGMFAHSAYDVRILFLLALFVALAHADIDGLPYEANGSHHST